MSAESISESLASPMRSSASPQRVLSESLESLSESLETLDDEAITPEPMTFTEAIDPVDVMVRFIQRLTQHPTKHFPITKDRDRLIVTLLLAIIADPNHHMNEGITRPLLKVYLERGGRVYRRGLLSYAMRDIDQFDHTVQYLYDYGLPVFEIARALGSANI